MALPIRVAQLQGMRPAFDRGVVSQQKISPARFQFHCADSHLALQFVPPVGEVKSKTGHQGADEEPQRQSGISQSKRIKRKKGIISLHREGIRSAECKYRENCLQLL